MPTALKTTFASITFGLCLTVSLSAGELSLGGGSSAGVIPARTGTSIDERVHLGIDRGEQNNSLVCELPTVQTTIAAPVNSTTAPGVGMAAPVNNQNPDWVTNGATHTLTLDASAPGQPSVAAMASTLPAGNAAGFGAGESWMYAGLGILLAALAWVCGTGVRQHRSTVPWTPGGEGAVRLSRTPRVKMVVYKP